MSMRPSKRVETFGGCIAFLPSFIVGGIFGIEEMSLPMTWLYAVPFVGGLWLCYWANKHSGMLDAEWLKHNQEPPGGGPGFRNDYDGRD